VGSKALGQQEMINACNKTRSRNYMRNEYDRITKKKKTGKKQKIFMDSKNQKISEGSASTKKIKVNKTKYKTKKFLLIAKTKNFLRAVHQPNISK
jgi:hypothetical protein